MSDVFATRAGPSWAAHPSKPPGEPMPGKSRTADLAAGSWDGARSGRAPRQAAGRESASPEPPRIRIDVPLGTPYLEIRESILRQAWELAGTQARAAAALGITPETVSRFLLRRERERLYAPRGSGGLARGHASGTRPSGEPEIE